MKKSIVLFTLFLSSFIYAQSAKSYVRERNTQFAISATQDAKLAFCKDESGNIPFTLDLTAKMEWRFYSDKLGFLSLILMYEKANLYGGDYMAYGVYGGYTFDEWLYIPAKKSFGRDWDLEITPYLGLSDIKRKFTENTTTGWQSFNTSLNLGVDFTIKIYDDFGIVFDLKWNSRTDLKYQYEEFNEDLSFNFGIGCKWEFY
jgi:hypothetical protein